MNLLRIHVVKWRFTFIGDIVENSKDLMIDKYLPQSCVRTGGKEMILLTSLMDKGR